MEKDIFHKVREQLDQYALGFPSTESEVEIKLLKVMFTEDEALMFNQLTAALETPESVSRRISRPLEEVAVQLENMAKKGLLFRNRKGEQLEYSAVPFIHGLLEFQVTRLGQEMVKLAGDYINQKYKHNMAQGTQAFIRTIPVQHSLDVKHKVAPYEDAREILRNNKDLIVITECACRQQKALFNKACERPREVCFMFGPMGQYYIDNDLGHQIDLDEAFRVLDKAQEHGLITQPASSQRPFTMCNCCVDCCGILRAVSKHPNPADLVFSNYRAELDREKCLGCGICVDRCQIGAITMNVDGRSEIDVKRCIGCGLCVTSCSAQARVLVPKSEDGHRVPVADTAEQFTELIRNRGLREIKPSQVVSFGFENNHLD